MTLRIQNKYILGLGRWLSGLSLSGQESRNRTKFVEELSVQLQENELTRLEILKKYAEKDEKGELVMVDEGDSKHYVVPDEKLTDFQKEYTAYLDQDFVMGGEGLKTRLQMISDIVLNSTEKIAPEVAPDYDKWCEAFEKMVEENKQ